jgi:AraC-like DNA-binding protein
LPHTVSRRRNIFRPFARLADEAPHRRSLKTSRISIQLEPGELRVASTWRRLSGFSLEEMVANRTSLHRMCAAPRSVLLVLGAVRPGTLFVEGHDLGSDGCVIVEDGTELELVAHAWSPWLAIPLDGESAENRALRSAPRSTELRTGVRLIRLSDAVPPARPAERALVRALQAVGGIDTRVAAAAPTRDQHLRRRLAVERARAFIRDNLAETIRLPDLCAHAGLRSRALEYGFRETVRLPPMTYVRMLRLAEVRKLLLDDVARPRDISAIALDTGFSHVSQFIVDYKKVFGETPSMTRANAWRSKECRQPRPRCRESVATPRSRFAHFSPACPAA